LSEADEEKWVPLSHEKFPESHEVLVEGVPEWLKNSINEWVTERFTLMLRIDPLLSFEDTPKFDLKLLRRAERACKFSIPYTTDAFGQQIINDAVLTIWRTLQNDEQVLDLLDFLLADADTVLAFKLNSVLFEGGSAWTVGERRGGIGLVRRVEETVLLRTNETIQNSGSAGMLLKQAWDDVYSVNPKPSDAYFKAIKAVEQISIPKVIPKQNMPNLSLVANQMEQDGDWYLSSGVEITGQESNQIVVSLIRYLWHGHHNRHAGTTAEHNEISQMEAETAVSVAVTLVDWFARGLVARQDVNEKSIYRKSKKLP